MSEDRRGGQAPAGPAHYVSQHKKPTPFERELLDGLQEEAAELIVAVAKFKKFGGLDGYPGTGRTNVGDASMELGNIQFMAQMCVDWGLLDPATISYGYADKQRKFRKFQQAQSDDRDVPMADQRALSDAYVRLRAMIPGAFDTPTAPTSQEVWTQTEASLRVMKDQAVEALARQLWLQGTKEPGPDSEVPPLKWDEAIKDRWLANARRVLGW